MSIFARLRNLWIRDALDRNLQEELKSHLDMRIADNIASVMT